MAQRTSLPKYFWPAVTFALAGGAIVLSGRDIKGPGGLDIIRGPDQYQEYNAKARDLTLPAFTAADRGDAPTDAQKADVRKALPYFEAMNAYAPIKVGPYFAVGKVHAILGDPAAAGRAPSSRRSSTAPPTRRRRTTPRSRRRSPRPRRSSPSRSSTRRSRPSRASPVCPLARGRRPAASARVMQERA